MPLKRLLFRTVLLMRFLPVSVLPQLLGIDTQVLSVSCLPRYMKVILHTSGTVPCRSRSLVRNRPSRPSFARKLKQKTRVPHRPAVG